MAALRRPPDPWEVAYAKADAWIASGLRAVAEDEVVVKRAHIHEGWLVSQIYESESEGPHVIGLLFDAPTSASHPVGVVSPWPPEACPPTRGVA